MKNTKQILSALLCSSIVFFSPGLSCYQALAGEGIIDPVAGSDAPLEAGPLSVAGQDMPVGGTAENLGNLSQDNISKAYSLSSEVTAQTQRALVAKKSQNISKFENETAVPAETQVFAKAIPAEIIGAAAPAAVSAQSKASAQTAGLKNLNKGSITIRSVSALKAKMNALGTQVKQIVSAENITSQVSGLARLFDFQLQPAFAYAGATNGFQEGSRNGRILLMRNSRENPMAQQAAATRRYWQEKAAETRQAMQNASQNQKPAVPTPTVSPEQAQKPVKYAPSFGVRMLGAIIAAFGVFPLMIGYVIASTGHPAGTLLFIGGASMFTGLLILAPGMVRPLSPDDLASKPGEAPFLGFLGVVAAFWASTAVVNAVISGGTHIGNTWIAAVLYGGGALLFAAIDIMKEWMKGAPKGLAAFVPLGIFAGWIGSAVTMFQLRDWMNGMGVLVGFGAFSAALVAAFLLPKAVVAVSSLLQKISGHGAHLPQLGSLSMPQKTPAVIWGTLVAAGILSLAALTLHLPALVIAAPIFAVMAFYILLARSRR